jgi:DNA-binding HxlR family transcriptional regulator
MARHRDPEARRSGCPISISLELFGDRWTLLIVRDLMFKELCTFGEFAGAGEGIATNVLADRLARLEDAGIIVRRPDAADGRRVVYRLTRKGMELAPVLVELVLWAARHEATEAPPAVVARMTADRAGFIAGLWDRWRASDVESRPPSVPLDGPAARGNVLG